jgi:hypothetical protein
MSSFRSALVSVVYVLLKCPFGIGVFFSQDCGPLTPRSFVDGSNENSASIFRVKMCMFRKVI